MRNIADLLRYANGRDAAYVAAVRASIPPIESHCPKRLLVDLSVILKHDAGTGIQRVVRSIRNELPGALRQGIVIDDLMIRHMEEGYVTIAGDAPQGGSDSLFLGLDFSTDAVFHAREQLQRLRATGTPIWFLVHDILPMSHPQWFTAASQLKYRRWMRICAALADGILCVSSDTAERVEKLLLERYRRVQLPRIVTITPGSYITTSDSILGSEQLPNAPGLDGAVFAKAILIVGTLEPRKGHADALAALELLWAEGYEIPLVLIGRGGWNTVALQRAIRSHSALGRTLFWCDDVCDEGLHAAYRHCSLVLVPSLSEGYGLPIDEALALGSPVLARDIRVFRRHADSQLRFFPTQASPRELADSILETYRSAHRNPPLPKLFTWHETAQEVAKALNSHR